MLKILFLFLLCAPLKAVVWHAEMSEEDSRKLAWSEDAFMSTCRVIVRNEAGDVLINGTGVLIADRWVLTAKHLFKDTTDPKGITCEFERDEGGKRTVLKSTSFSSHAPDIGLIKLRRDAPKWIPRVPPFTASDEVESGLVFTKVGYGGIDSRSRDSNIRRAITNTYSEADDDWLHYERDDKSKTGEATEWEGSTAPGDSGGPAFVFRDDSWWVSSVTYGVIPVHGPRETRVSTRLDWIREVTGLVFPSAG